MTSLWRQKAEATLAIIQPVARKKAVRPAKAIESGNHSCRNTAYSSRRSKKGFTLIELIVVMLILAILVGIVIISIGGAIGRSQGTAYDGEDESIRIAVTTYYVAYTEWPTATGESGPIAMGNLTSPPGGELPYLDTTPQSAHPVNGGTGHYIWSVGTDSRVTSMCSPAGECPNGVGDGYQGVYP